MLQEWGWCLEPPFQDPRSPGRPLLPVRNEVLPVRKEVLGLGLGKGELRTAPCHETEHSTLGVAQSKAGPGRSEASRRPYTMERTTFRPRGYQ